MIRYALLCIAFALFTATAALACSSPPSHMYVNHDAAIEDASWIALASPIRRVETDRGMAYEMQALEYLKGEGPSVFSIENGWQRAANGHSVQAAEANYYGHSVSTFWEFGGLYSNWSDCKIHPGFYFTDQKYLIFGPLDYNVGFENVTDVDDVWLEYVREKVSGLNPAKPFPLDATEYLRRAEAVLRVQVSWDGTSSHWIVDRLTGPDLPYLNMAHVSPSAAFDSMIDPNCDPLLAQQERPEALDFLYVFERLPKGNVKKVEGVFCMGGNKEANGSVEAYGRFSLTGVRAFDIEAGSVRLSKECGAFYEDRCKTPVATTDIQLADVEELFR
ncbi:MAG: hypothetical protein AAGH87_05270 [Pseudomonadota bacterium]